MRPQNRACFDLSDSLRGWLLGNLATGKQLLGECLEVIQVLCSQAGLPLIRFVRGCWRAITNAALRPYGESTHMSDEKRGPEGNPRSALTGNNVEARPKNWLVPVTLVLLRQWSSHGYELMERAVELGFETINPGTLYRTLRKMEKDGLCQSDWETTTTSSGGPPRRMYSITDAGGAYLDLWVRSMSSTSRPWMLSFRPIGAVGPAHK